MNAGISTSTCIGGKGNMFKTVLCTYYFERSDAKKTCDINTK